MRKNWRSIAEATGSRFRPPPSPAPARAPLPATPPARRGCSVARRAITAAATRKIAAGSSASLEAGGERLGPAMRARRADRRCARSRRGEDRDAEGAAEPDRRVDQRRGEARPCPAGTPAWAAVVTPTNTRAEPERHDAPAPGSRSLTYEPSTGIRESQKMPPAPRSARRRRSPAGCRRWPISSSRSRPRWRRRASAAGRRRRPRSGEAEHVLHVERDEEEHRVEAGHRDDLRHVGGREALDPEDREREQRVAVAALVGERRARGAPGAREAGDGPARRPSRRRAPRRSCRRAAASRR